jgi:hypothetical protein
MYTYIYIFLGVYVFSLYYKNTPDNDAQDAETCRANSQPKCAVTDSAS